MICTTHIPSSSEGWLFQQRLNLGPKSTGGHDVQPISMPEKVVVRADKDSCGLQRQGREFAVPRIGDKGHCGQIQRVRELSGRREQIRDVIPGQWWNPGQQMPGFGAGFFGPDKLDLPVSHKVQQVRGRAGFFETCGNKNVRVEDCPDGGMAAHQGQPNTCGMAIHIRPAEAV